MFNFYDVISWCLTILYTCQPGQLHTCIIISSGSLKTVELHRRLCTIGSWEYLSTNAADFHNLEDHFQIDSWIDFLLKCASRTNVVALPSGILILEKYVPGLKPPPVLTPSVRPQCSPQCKSSENLLKSNDISKQRLAYNTSDQLFDTADQNI